MQFAVWQLLVFLVLAVVDIGSAVHARYIADIDQKKCRGKTRKYNKAMHQLNGRRDSAITLSTRPFDFDLCLRMGRGLG
ncbi:hypothetical protein J6590_030876 [Homalodisca vitripennis]|nr:hypothetical protein J6590_030876 [Homalodisca vitripennis]